MKLRSIRIENFRAFQDVTIPVNDYTCIVGPNGVGKSAVIAALNVFFRNTSTAPTNVVELHEEDFHQRDTTRPVKITLTFQDLSDEARKDLSHYVRQGKLVVTSHAAWDALRRSAPVEQYGTRLGIKAFAEFFKDEEQDAKVAELKGIYAKIRQQFDDLPAPGTKQAMHDALRTYEEAHGELCDEIPSRQEFYGVTRGKGLLDKHIQWIHVPAVKDATEEDTESRNTWLGQLLQRAVRSKVRFDEEIQTIRTEAQGKYQQLLASQQDALKDLSTALTRRMAEWANPDAVLNLLWAGDPEKSVSVSPPFARVEAGDGMFTGTLVRQGHGFQRSYLLTLLQELASSQEGQGPTLFLACEEPELYQHPPQARHLAGVLESLAETGSQILICTHSPYFVSGRGFPDVRLIRRSHAAKESSVAHATFDDVVTMLRDAGGHAPANQAGARVKLHQVLQPGANEMFFAPVLVLVEGLEDAAFLAAHLALSGKDAVYRRLGCHVVAAEGKSRLVLLLAVAKGLGVPTFVVFDSDADTRIAPAGASPEVVKKCGERSALHLGDNSAIFGLCGAVADGPFPAADVWRPGLVAWYSRIGDVVRGEVGDTAYRSAEAHVRQVERLSEAGLEKNQLFIGRVVEHLWDAGAKSQSLDRLCDEIIAYAKSQRPPEVAGPS